MTYRPTADAPGPQGTDKPGLGLLDWLKAGRLADALLVVICALALFIAGLVGWAIGAGVFVP